MNESHASLRDDYKVSCAELDFIVEAAQSLPGVAGCRMTGGGFGGSAIALVRVVASDSVAEHIKAAYKGKFGSDIEVFLRCPTGGAFACKV